jgi:hypothetical protein
MIVLSAGVWVCGLTQSQTKDSREIEPVHADDQIGFFDQGRSQLCSDANKGQQGAGGEWSEMKRGRCC